MHTPTLVFSLDGNTVTCLRCGHVSSGDPVAHFFCDGCGRPHLTGDPWYLAEPMYRLMTLLLRGETNPTLDEGRGVTIRAWKALVLRGLVRPGPTITHLGLTAMRSFEAAA